MLAVKSQLAGTLRICPLYLDLYTLLPITVKAISLTLHITPYATIPNETAALPPHP